MSDDGEVEITELRLCAAIGCDRDMTVSIHYRATQGDVDGRFRALGWRGYFCPTHAHLNRLP